MSIIVVSSGVTSGGVDLHPFQLMFVEDGGTASATEVRGAETVSSGGDTVDDTVSSGGLQTVLPGGSASDVDVLSGGGEWLFVGSHDSGVTVSSGGSLVLASLVVPSHADLVFEQPTSAASSIWGATLDVGARIHLAGAIVHGGGTLTLDAGVDALGATVSAGASLVGDGDLHVTLLDEGLVSGVRLSLIAADVKSGGVIEGDAFEGGAAVAVGAGGHADGVVVGSGAAAVVSGGDIVSSFVHAHGAVGLLSGGEATRTVVSGGMIDVQSGGEADGTILRGAGAQRVGWGGLASATAVSSGGRETLAGGDSDGAIVFSGGAEVADAGAAAGLTLGSGAVLDWNSFSAKLTDLTLTPGAEVFVRVTSAQAAISGPTLSIENDHGHVVGSATLANTDFSLVAIPRSGGVTELLVAPALGAATGAPAALLTQAMAAHGATAASPLLATPHSATTSSLAQVLSPR